MPYRGYVATPRTARNPFPKDFCACGRIKMVRSVRCYTCYTSWPERFWAKVERTWRCWNWLGQIDRDGYGIVSFDGKNQKAHRIGWTMALGLPPDDLTIDHLCRNKRCVRPLHMELVSSSVNAGRRWWWT